MSLSSIGYWKARTGRTVLQSVSKHLCFHVTARSFWLTLSVVPVLDVMLVKSRSTIEIVTPCYTSNSTGAHYCDGELR